MIHDRLEFIPYSRGERGGNELSVSQRSPRKVRYLNGENSDRRHPLNRAGGGPHPQTRFGVHLPLSTRFYSRD